MICRLIKETPETITISPEGIEKPGAECVKIIVRKSQLPFTSSYVSIQFENGRKIHLATTYNSESFLAVREFDQNLHVYGIPKEITLIKNKPPQGTQCKS